MNNKTLKTKPLQKLDLAILLDHFTASPVDMEEYKLWLDEIHDKEDPGHYRGWLKFVITDDTQSRGIEIIARKHPQNGGWQIKRYELGTTVIIPKES